MAVTSARPRPAAHGAPTQTIQRRAGHGARQPQAALLPFAAGNRAVTGYVQRKAAKVERTLAAGCFQDQPRLTACLNDRGRLREGDRGEDVRAVQMVLLDLGYDLGPAGADGIYGPATTAAIRRFKTDHLGWQGAADIGPLTMELLDRFANQAPPGPEPRPDPVPPVPVPTEPAVISADTGQNAGPTPADASTMPIPSEGPRTERGGGGLDLEREAAPGLGERGMFDGVGYKLWSFVSMRHFNLMTGLWSKVAGTKDKLLNAVGRLASDGVQALVKAIATVVGGPIGAAAVQLFTSVFNRISSWFGGESLGDWIARQAKRLISPLFSPFDRAIDRLGDLRWPHYKLSYFQQHTRPADEVMTWVRTEQRSRLVQTGRGYLSWFVNVLHWLQSTLHQLGLSTPIDGGLAAVEDFSTSALDYTDPDRELL